MLNEYQYCPPLAYLEWLEGEWADSADKVEGVARAPAPRQGQGRPAAGGTIPPPLADSPKCQRCSLVGICLPDEVNCPDREQTPPRPLAVGRDEAMLLRRNWKNGEMPEPLLDEFRRDIEQARRAPTPAELTARGMFSSASRTGVTRGQRRRQTRAAKEMPCPSCSHVRRRTPPANLPA